MLETESVGDNSINYSLTLKFGTSRTCHPQTDFVKSILYTVAKNTSPKIVTKITTERKICRQHQCSRDITFYSVSNKIFKNYMI